MVLVICGLTLRQLLAQRRTWLVVILAAIPVLLGVVLRFTDEPEVQDHLQEVAADALLGSLVAFFVLPLTALIFGTAALGQEFEDGTAVYLLARPTPRWQIVLGKMLGAWIATSAVAIASVTLSALTLLVGEADLGAIVLAFNVAMVNGALGYVALFVCLSVITGRALMFGIGYVFVWEATITSLAPGTQYLSVREYTLAIAEGLASLPASVFEADLDAGPASVLLAVLVVAATVYAVRRLQRYQITSAVS